MCWCWPWRLGDVGGWNCGLYEAPADGSFDGIGRKKLSAEMYSVPGTDEEWKAVSLLKSEAALTTLDEVNFKGPIK